MAINSEHFHTLRVSHFLFGLTSISAITATQPLIKTESGPNGAISLKQTFNLVLYHFCNRQYFDVHKAKKGIGEQSCIVQPLGRGTVAEGLEIRHCIMRGMSDTKYSKTISWRTTTGARMIILYGGIETKTL